jgi:hypothetical protein
MARCVVIRRLWHDAARQLSHPRSITVIGCRGREAALAPAAPTRIRLSETSRHHLDYHGT